jgi:hypothetical protein
MAKRRGGDMCRVSGPDGTTYQVVVNLTAADARRLRKLAKVTGASHEKVAYKLLMGGVAMTEHSARNPVWANDSHEVDLSALLTPRPKPSQKKTSTGKPLQVIPGGLEDLP